MIERGKMVEREGRGDNRLRLDNLAIRRKDRNKLPASTSPAPNVGTMLGQRLRRWSNIVPTLGERLVFAGRIQTWVF